MAMSALNNRHVRVRRQIHLQSPSDLLAEVDRIQASASVGSVRPSGNWTAAQAFQHLAKFIEYSFDGFPFRYPWPYRVVVWLIRRVSWSWLLKLTFRPGFTNPPVVARAVDPDAAVTLEHAGQSLRRQIRRILDGERMVQRSPTGEPVSHEQWVEAHLRHAELHLSFLHLEPDVPAELAAAPDRDCS
jgi:peptidoglycan/xylan/chitin deacetylase (PgdA/CDA1 family)